MSMLQRLMLAMVTASMLMPATSHAAMLPVLPQAIALRVSDLPRGFREVGDYVDTPLTDPNMGHPGVIMRDERHFKRAAPTGLLSLVVYTYWFSSAAYAHQALVNYL